MATKRENSLTQARRQANTEIMDIRDKLEKVRAYAEALANDPDLNWGHVGSLGRVNELLNNIMDH